MLKINKNYKWLAIKIGKETMYYSIKNKSIKWGEPIILTEKKGNKNGL